MRFGWYLAVLTGKWLMVMIMRYCTGPRQRGLSDVAEISRRLVWNWERLEGKRESQSLVRLPVLEVAPSTQSKNSLKLPRATCWASDCGWGDRNPTTFRLKASSRPNKLCIERTLAAKRIDEL